MQAEMTPPPAPTPRLSPPALIAWLARQRALPAFVGAFAVWMATSAVAGRGTFATLSSGAEVATFLMLVGIGQMFVITVGNGGIDLSVPYVMTLSAYLTSSVMGGHNAGLIGGIAVAVGVGLVTSLVNVSLIELLAMPPIVATLAVGFVVDTVVLVRSTSTQGTPSPALVSFVTDTVGRVPVIVIFGIVVALCFAWILRRTSYGRSVQAVGQSRAAARLAGIRCRRTTVVAYVICGVAASLTGLLLAGYAGGPSLDMATSYQLESIAVVVLGGSLIAGGRSNVPGVWAGALLLTLLITLVNVANLGAGLEDIVEGALIVAVLVVGGTRRE
jgi:ribose transport system permease protein